MKAKEELIYALNAGYSYFYIPTFEVPKTVGDLIQILEGYKIPDTENQCYFPKLWDYEFNEDPSAILGMMSVEGEDSSRVVIAKNFNWFLWDESTANNQPEKSIVTFLQNNVERFSSDEYRAALIIVGVENFENAIPKDLQRDFITLEFGLPDAGEIKEIYDFTVETAKENPRFKKPNSKEEKRVLDASRGMTRREIVNALSFSVIRDQGKLSSKTVAEIRAQNIENTAGIKAVDFSGFNFDNLKGYEVPKDLFLTTYQDSLALGMILVGPAGTGKTMFAKCAGGESGLPVYEAEFAELFGGLVGESEAKWRLFIEVVCKLAPCILFCDEIEKGLAGSKRGQLGGDGGTTKRSTAQFLKLLSDKRPEGLYIIATCNDVYGMDAAWLRAERWDCAPIYIPLPHHEQQIEILEYYKKFFGVEGEPKSMKGWSGAEIRSACRMAKMRKTTIDESSKFIIPVAETMKEEIDELEKWRVGRALMANEIPLNEPKIKKPMKRKLVV